jgi:hypothetical protein
MIGSYCLGSLFVYTHIIGTKETDMTNRVELIEGKLYQLFAGPYKSTITAMDRVDSLFAESLISWSDQPRIRNKAIYVLGE